MEILETPDNGTRTNSHAPARKPTSEKAKAANRRNAKRSTGPKTKQGKARSRMNALKHGLSAKTLTAKDYGKLLGDENVEEMVKAVRKRFASPCPLVQSHVEAVAHILMKLHLAQKLESSALAAQLPDNVSSQLKSQRGKATGLTFKQLQENEKAFKELVAAFEQGRVPKLPANDIEWFAKKVLNHLQPSGWAEQASEALPGMEKHQKALARKQKATKEETERETLAVEVKLLDSQIEQYQSEIDREQARLDGLKSEIKSMAKISPKQLAKLIRKNDLNAVRARFASACAKALLEDGRMLCDLKSLRAQEAEAVASHEQDMERITKNPEMVCGWQPYTLAIQRELRLALENLQRMASLDLP